MYLGSSTNSNDHYVGRRDGVVTRARTLARVPLERRWDSDLLAKITGTPDKPNPSGLDDAVLEASHLLHEDADKDLSDLLSKEGTDIGLSSAWQS